MARIF